MADTASRLHESTVSALVQLLSCYHRGILAVNEWNQRMSKSTLSFLSVQVQQHSAELDRDYHSTE